MRKLTYVAVYEPVNFTYLVAVIVEAKLRSCPIFDFIDLQLDHSRSVESFNEIIDWLVKTKPDEFQLVE